MFNHARIDVHQHIVPPFWVDALDSHGGDPSGWKSPHWSPDAAISFMDSQQIATGVLSLTAPGASGWQGQERRDMARRVNEYAATLVNDRPERFGNFATLPLPDMDGALSELAYAQEQLHVDGIVLLSNYQGRYLGDPFFVPLWDEIARREIVVFLHPASPAIPVLDGLPGPLIDYPYDTTRAAMQLVHSGIFERHPQLKIILSHAGGFVPFASHRFAELLFGLNPDGPTVDSIIGDLQRFYFDTALSSGSAALPSLIAFAKPDHILYGSDFPYAPASVGASFTKQLDAYEGFSDSQRVSIDNGAARLLFQRRSAPASLVGAVAP